MKTREYQKIIDEMDLGNDFFEHAEKLQKKAKRRVFLMALSFIACFLGMGLAFLLSYYDYFGVLFIFMSFPALALSGYFANKAKKEYANYVKDNIVSSMFSKQFDSFHFQPDKGFNKEYIKSTNMYPIGNIFESNDLLIGTYIGVGFTQADVLIQNKSSNGKGQTQTTTFFQGRWLIYDFNKNFSGSLEIRSNYGRVFFKNKKGFSLFNHNNLEEIKFENSDFNEMFTSYTNNKHDAFYIITPHMMENMIKLNQELNCEIVIAFIDNKLHIAIYNDEDAFEVGVGKVNMEYINSVQKDIDLIKWVVDGLELTKDIYKS